VYLFIISLAMDVYPRVLEKCAQISSMVADIDTRCWPNLFPGTTKWARAITPWLERRRARLGRWPGLTPPT
jgi:hypothetical protein